MEVGLPIWSTWHFSWSQWSAKSEVSASEESPVLLVESHGLVLTLALWLMFALGTVLLASFMLKSSLFVFQTIIY